MTNHAIQTTAVRISHDDLQIDAYLAEPTGGGTYPGIVVVQEIWGVNSHIRSVTERLAKEGYVAIAPAIFQRSAPSFEGNYDADSTTLGRKYKDQTRADELLSDVQAAIAYLRTLPTVEGDAIGAIGFCFGGHVVYLAATLPDVKATASFYGAGIATMTPGGGAPTLTRTPEINGTLYAFFGTTDPLIPVEQIDQVEAALKEHQINHRFFRYPSGHGFFCDQRPDYSPEAAADAWEKVKELFESVLKGEGWGVGSRE
ncbi:MAG: dienelactone hydrolase family protein [Tildeniella nuda ZEHNDER 1965/U140]|jgi:carboxymethylenebutenolidase|nr:dienelactone hydrolase family protein [Tildeniella nuda ZEHNDER 1965/U140]